MEGDLLLGQSGKYRIEIKYTVITLLLLLLVVILNVLAVFEGLNNGINNVVDTVADLGFIGVFIVSVVGNTTLIIQVPYTSVFIPPALLAGTTYNDMVLLGLAAGIGAGIGEVLSYGVADKILQQKQDLGNSRLVQWVKKTVTDHPRIISPFIVVWTTLPIFPDDAIIIPLAMIKYGQRKIIVPFMVGKITHCLMIASAAYYFTDFMAGQLESESRSALALGVFILFLMFIFYQIEKARTIMKDKRAELSA